MKIELEGRTVDDIVQQLGFRNPDIGITFNHADFGRGRTYGCTIRNHRNGEKIVFHSGKEAMEYLKSIFYEIDDLCNPQTLPSL